MQLALQPFYSAEFASFANSSVALMVGVALTGVICGIVRFLGTGWIARPVASKQLGDAGRGRRTQVMAGSRRGRQPDAASSGPACPAHCRGSRGGEERRRQSSPAADGAEHHRYQAGKLWPVTRRKSRDRGAARASCRDQPGQYAGPLPDELLGQLDSTIAFTLQEPAGEARNEALIGLAGIRSGLFREAPPISRMQPEQREMAA